MKIIASSLLLLPFLTAIVAAPTQSGEDAITWPETVDLPLKSRSGSAGGLSNRERFQRGLGPAKPARLYNVVKDLGKRIDPAPSSASYNGQTYRFQGCYEGFAGVRSFESVHASNPFEAVSLCAARTKNDQTFAVGEPFNGDYNCILTPGSLQQLETCNDSNYAVYGLPG